MAAATETKAVVTRERDGASSLAEVQEDVLQKRYGLNRAELNAIKTALAPQGSTDYEVMLYVGVCNRLKLDPFVPGLVHFARFENRDGSGYRTGIILGVYGYIALAQQDPAYDGFEVKSYPEDVEKPVTHATCTVWRKGSTHPTEVTVVAKEARARAPKSRLWPESPRHMTENAAIRRAMRYAYPTLFAAVDEGEAEDVDPPEARGRVGTFLGEHHDTPAIAPPEGPTRAEAEKAAPVTVEARVVEPTPVAPAAPPTPAPKAAAPVVPQSKIEEVARAIREYMEDPAVRDDRDLWRRTNDLLNSRLDAMQLEHLGAAKGEHLPGLEALRDDLARIVSGA